MALLCVGAARFQRNSLFVFPLRRFRMRRRALCSLHTCFVFFFILSIFFLYLSYRTARVDFCLISFPVRWAGPLRWDGRSYGVDVRGPACSPAASPGPPSEPRTAAALQPALRHPRSPSERYAHQHGLCCQRRFKAGQRFNLRVRVARAEEPTLKLVFF